MLTLADGEHGAENDNLEKKTDRQAAKANEKRINFYYCTSDNRRYNVIQDMYYKME